MTLFEFLSELVGIPTVVGFEHREAARIGKLCTDYSAGFLTAIPPHRPAVCSFHAAAAEKMQKNWCLTLILTPSALP